MAKINFRTCAAFVVAYCLMGSFIRCSLSEELEGDVNAPVSKIEGKIDFRTSKHKGEEYIAVTLNGDAYYTLVKADGSFSFSNVKPGAYLLEVHSTAYMFRPIRVEVSAKTANKVKVSHVVGPQTQLSHPLKIMPDREMHYYEPRESYNFASLLSNPMVLMALFSGVMMLVYPKMLENMDPETLKQMQEGGLTGAMQGVTPPPQQSGAARK
eukprot:TRINITY_DN5965_c0_g1_i1.p1 TRINITY_DN5965_c0_g1~~TRINITY_DN5965_c0_g1_i1.p1  ORF type:complete len:211 (+),score=49.52 TRINITY_DN5965_c0_g1_i1:53-685(+)